MRREVMSTRAAIRMLQACGVFMFFGFPGDAIHAQSTRIDRPDAATRRDLAALRREVMTFDFEEAEMQPYTLPIHFYRVLSGTPGPDNVPSPPGFPIFGSMYLSDEQAASGRWSFCFEPNGGSMAARIPTGVCPVLPGADYDVSVRVRSSTLIHGRARLRAWLHDDNGRVITDSIVDSELVTAEHEWRTVRIVVPGQHLPSADLVVELQVLQPGEYDPAVQQDDVPAYSDINARVWFDDLVIRNRPRVMLSTGQSGNVFGPGDTPELLLDVYDVTLDDVDAVLTIRDIDDRVIASDTIAVLPNAQTQRVSPDISSFGWYRADLHVYDGSEVVADRTIDFVVLSDEEHGTDGAGSFGVNLPVWSREDTNVTIELLRHLGVGNVQAPISSDHGQSQTHALADLLIASRYDATLALIDLPGPLAREHGLDPLDVVSFVARGQHAWQQVWAADVVEFGLDVTHWQLGEMSFNAPAPEPHVYDDAYAALQSSIPTLTINIPRGIDTPFNVSSKRIPPHIEVPAAVRPNDIGPALAMWGDHPSGPVTIEQLDDDRFRPRDRLIDLTRRTLRAWTAHDGTLRIDAPWRRSDENTFEATPAFCIWRELTRVLAGRERLATLTTPDGMHAWVLSQDERGESALIVWDERAMTGAPRALHARLSPGMLTMTDLFGNRSTVPMRDGRHVVEAGSLPVVVHGIDEALTLFRASFAIDEPFIPAESRLHRRAIELRNPWPVAITGELRLRDAAGLDIRPRNLAFTLDPGMSTALPIDILVERSSVAGVKPLDFDVTLHADREHRLRLSATMDIGLRRLDCSATWRQTTNVVTGESDVVVSVYVTNRDTTALNLDVFLAAPGSGRQHQLVAGLTPGSTTLRTFRVPGGGRTLSGQQVLVGVTERDGVARLNLAVDIPPLTSEEAVTP